MSEIKIGRVVLRSSILNSVDSKLKSIDAVPIGNKQAYKDLFGEEEPYEFISVVKIGKDAPAKPDYYTTVILTKEWAQSYVNAVSKIPKPLFVNGHAELSVHPKSRAIPDGYVVGGLVQDELFYLRNALPKGETENEKALVTKTIREIKAGMLSTSTSDVMRYKIEVDQDSDEVLYLAEESVKGQSNALVEEDQTGSEAAIILTSFKAVDGRDGEEGEEQMGEQTISVKEQLVSLKNQIDSGRLALSEVASGLGIDLMTSKQGLALKRLNDAESKVGNITDFVAKEFERREKDFVALKTAKIKEVFKTEELIEIAEPLFQLKEGTVDDINTEVERISNLKVFKTINGKLAGDMNFRSGNDADTSVTFKTDAADEVMEG